MDPIISALSAAIAAAPKATGERAAEPQLRPGFDADGLLGQFCAYVDASQELLAALRASGLADSTLYPFGSLRMHLACVAAILPARCEELAALIQARNKGGSGGHVSAQGVASDSKPAGN